MATGTSPSRTSTGTRYADVEVGTEIPARDFPVQRWQLIQYAGASGDFNIIHWNERFAKAVGLPDVIAHGMFTMATAGRLLTDWAGDPAAVVDYGVRFSSMVPVPDDDQGATLTIKGRVEEKLPDNRVAVSVDARLGDNKVLTQARAVIRLP
jgi:acyl dehydratase